MQDEDMMVVDVWGLVQENRTCAVGMMVKAQVTALGQSDDVAVQTLMLEKEALALLRADKVPILVYGKILIAHLDTGAVFLAVAQSGN
jgi:hypothetical protein